MLCVLHTRMRKIMSCMKALVKHVTHAFMLWLIMLLIMFCINVLEN